MHIAVANFQGGVSKTTTAVHLANYLQAFGPTLLMDRDLNRCASAWAAHGKLPFIVINENQGVHQAVNFEHVVIDTGIWLEPAERHARDPQGH